MPISSPYIARGLEILRAEVKLVGDNPDLLAQSLRYLFHTVQRVEPINDTLTCLDSILEADSELQTFVEQDISKGNNDAAAVFPVEQDRRMACFWSLCKRLCHLGGVKSGERFVGLALMTKVVGFRARNGEQTVGQFVNLVVNPLLSYISSRLSSGDFLLALLWRYKRLVEWFECDELARRFGSEGLERPKWVEADLERVLLHHLMLQGVDFPISQPQLRNRRPDILLAGVPGQPEGHPVPLEVKVYDGGGRGREHIRRGFRQALQYAHDFQQPYGHLVVFNVAPDVRLQFGDREDAEPGVPFVKVQNKVIFCHPIQLGPVVSPSKAPSLKTFVWKEDELRGASL